MIKSHFRKRFFFLSAKWPGRVSDARVLRNSSMATRFEQGWRPFENAVLLCDSIYGASDWLIPMKPSTPNELETFYRHVYSEIGGDQSQVPRKKLLINKSFIII